MSVVRKMYVKILINRVMESIERGTDQEQCDFRKERKCSDLEVDYEHGVNRLRRSTQEKSFKLAVLFFICRKRVFIW